MYRIALINMPFGAVYRPSLALTQLQSTLLAEYSANVAVDVCYVNQDCARYLGVDVYTDIAEGGNYNFGLGDWIFRHLAFPWLPDNTDEYLHRYFPQRDSNTRQFKSLIREKQSGLDSLLDDLIEKYGLRYADLVGFTSMFSQNVACFALARKLKALRPDMIVAMGGANCEAPMGQEIVKNVDVIDYVFSGPSIKTFREFVGHQLNGTSEACHVIDGVFSKANCGDSFTRVGPLGAELDMDVDVPLEYEPFLQAVERHFPDGEIMPSLTFETSRGCWWGERAHCTFCGLNGLTMKYRSMQPDKAIAQFRSLFKYADRIAGLECVDNIMPTNFPHDVFAHLETPQNIAIFYEVKANLSDDDVKMLSSARVKVIQPGIEALATSTLALMRKGSTAFQNLSLLKSCVMNDVYAGWNILVGFPGEREEVYEKYVHDIPLLTHLPPPVAVYPVRFDRYSPYFQRSLEYRLNLHPCDFYELTYPFGADVLQNLAYYFMDHNFGAEYQVRMTRWVDRIRQKADLWIARWSGEDGWPQAKLYATGDSGRWTVYDSRFGPPRTYDIPDGSHRILGALATPQAPAQIAATLPDVAGGLQADLAFLQEKGLVFEEGGKFMSLVLEREPPPMSITRVTARPFGSLRQSAA